MTPAEREAMLAGQANIRARAIDIHGPAAAVKLSVAKQPDCFTGSAGGHNRNDGQPAASVIEGAAPAIDGEAALCAILGRQPLTAEQKAECEEYKAAQDKERLEQSIQSRYRRCGVPRRYWNVEWGAIVQSGLPRMTDAAGHAAGKDAIDDYIDRAARGEPWSLWLCGAAGTGKTTLACAITRELIRRGVECRYFKSPEILTRMADARTRSSRETQKGIIAEVTAPPFRVLDEIARSQTQEGEKSMLFQVIDTVYDELHSGIYITNLSCSELAQYMGDAAKDRFRGAGMSLQFTGPSYRGAQGELFTEVGE